MTLNMFRSRLQEFDILKHIFSGRAMAHMESNQIKSRILDIAIGKDAGELSECARQLVAYKSIQLVRSECNQSTMWARDI